MQRRMLRENVMGYAHVISEYLRDVFSLPKPLLERIGVDVEQDAYHVRFFTDGLLIKEGGVTWKDGQRAPETVAIVVLKYMLYTGSRGAKAYGDWVSFKDINGSGPFVGAFRQNVELRLETSFEGKAAILKSACERLGGVCLDLPNYHLAYEFVALPMIRLRLYFNDKEEIFPPKSVVLFDGSIERYLDVECIAALGWIFADLLQEDIKNSPSFLI